MIDSGLKSMNKLTSTDKTQEVRFDVMNYRPNHSDRQGAKVIFASITIGDSTDNYRLGIGDFVSGDAGL